MHQLNSILQQALYLVLVVSAPPVLMSLLVGFIIAVFQATTQIQEQTLSFAPKVIIVFGVLALTGPWIGNQLVRFTFHVFDQFPALIK
ncbi:MULTISPECIES: flagellar biosynthesis protein FliQ [Archangium]|jgi:flagellar biosynthetic protein FliQ|uniref:Flagellar biosynthetic protein FliQ n=2 Tax=Archangium TaxID=47 RepID=A0AAC8THF8_9BACT|nr:MULTISPECIES: flagellar biosynthesis protein FliQ [Archangium]HYO70501.1 flagellar biosynthesis protein FliQ [Archangium sp.]AKJ05820.1 Flagellar biosynthesis protein FliQ [Archangium gephyra]MCY1076238.1 flagellar biosynthesis protein FliQ [Archangium lansinium]REG27422.1 flagellar biosynthetic protein FliQ [Archangium gephyra]HZI06149.1 flagellar biosynthesis protein FliQ [Archangium sp.]